MKFQSQQTKANKSEKEKKEIFLFKAAALQSMKEVKYHF